MSEVHALRVEHAREAKPNGWWGMALFVATEATLFGTLIGTYFYLRFNVVRWPPPGVPDPGVALPLILTAVLVATALPIYAAVSAARDGHRARAWWLIALALLVQTGYFAMQIHLLADDIPKVDPQASSYGSIYVTLVGAAHAHVFVGLLLNLWLLALLVQTGYFAMQVHLLADDIPKVDPQASSYGSIYVTLVGAAHAHVFVGLLLNLWLLARLATGLTNYRLVGLRVIAFYWYFVYAVSVAVVLTQISPAL